MKVETSIIITLSDGRHVNAVVNAPAEYIDEAIDIKWASLKKALGDRIVCAKVSMFKHCPTSIFEKRINFRHYNWENLI